MHDAQESEARGRTRLAPWLGLVLILAVTWLGLSGIAQPLILGLGLASVLASALIAWRLGIADDEGIPLGVLARAAVYWAWLAWEIAKANWIVAKLVIDPRLPIAPRLIRTRASQANDLGQVIFANSITLTPGTISTDLDPGFIEVHCLNKALADDIESGDMDRRCSHIVAGRV